MSLLTCCSNATPTCHCQTVGAIMGLLTSSLLAAYFIFLEVFRAALRFHLDIESCENFLAESMFDSMLEYSVLVNVMLSMAPNRLVTMSWLLVHATIVIIALFIGVPVLFIEGRYTPLALYSGLTIIIVIVIPLTGLWISVCSKLRHLPTLNCDLLKTTFTVKVIFGVLSLVVCVIMCVDIFLGHFEYRPQLYRREQRFFTFYVPYMSSWMFWALATLTYLAVIIGSDGAKWRRSLMVPWMITHGIIIIGCVMMHQWFTTFCWITEKLIGLLFLIVGWLLMILWTAVWWIAAAD